MNKLKTLVCEICKQEAAKFDPDLLSYPLKGEMFFPIDSKWAQDDEGNDYIKRSDLPDPFPAWATYTEFRCPCCLNMPFIISFDTLDEATRTDLPKRLRTLDGFYPIVLKIRGIVSSNEKTKSVVQQKPKKKQKGKKPSSRVSCPYCKKEFKSRGLWQHKRACKKNPDRK